ncbi:Scr1 family TA system antitoxin-like transcriptional regulator [Streptomyces sp. NPDC057654]|uniref:helix-turn-helix domain-containing protein n=1 Tax=Streptomyces sp. NPDC057654 TaxID=3346196 RepID=UPI0036C5C2EA
MLTCKFPCCAALSGVIVCGQSTILCAHRFALCAGVRCDFREKGSRVTNSSSHEDLANSAKAFGRMIRALREQRGLTQKRLAEDIGVSESLIRMYEAGKRLVKEDVLQPLDDALGAHGVLLVVAPDVRVGDHPSWFAEYVEMETSALSLAMYETLVVPGLLQTENYARAVIGAHCPTLDDDEVESLVAARLERQVLLTRKPVAMLTFVIEEWVLRRPIGGRQVLKEQLLRLAEYAVMRNVTIQVMPADCESHAGFDGPLTLLETGEGKKIGYVEGQAGPVWITSQKGVSRLEQRYGNMRTQALSETKSLSLINKLAGEL